MAQTPYVKLSDLTPGRTYTITKYIKYFNNFGKHTIVIDLDESQHVHLPEWFVNQHLHNYHDFFKTHFNFIFQGMKPSKNNPAYQYANIDFPVVKKDIFYSVKEMLNNFKGFVIEECVEYEGEAFFDITFKSPTNGELIPTSLQLPMQWKV